MAPTEASSSTSDNEVNTEASKPDTAGLQAAPQDSTENGALKVTFSYRGQSHIAVLATSATIQDLSAYVDETLSLPTSHQKLLISPKPGLLKAPFPETSLAKIIKTPNGKAPKITVLGSTPTEISDLNANIARANRRNNRDFSTGLAKPVAPYRRTPAVQDLQNSTTYTFLQLRPLPHLPKPERSLAFLERLRADPGIKASMAKHKWSVPLLTEMDPAAHTTHDSRTLGLNRNKGEVIELRLRTDAYDGYRDYKTIRKTLCHELAHNVYGEHDRDFWDLCRQIEKETEAADWKSGGHRLTNEEIYEPTQQTGGDEGMVTDHGGWSGGEFVLGASTDANGTSSSSTLSRREILARAAEERMKKQQQKDQEWHSNEGV